MGSQRPNHPQGFSRWQVLPDRPHGIPGGSVLVAEHEMPVGRQRRHRLIEPERFGDVRPA